MAQTVQFGRQRTVSLDRLAVDASRGALLALILGFAGAALLGYVPSLETQMLIYLVGMIALNLPHGGYEHFTNLRRRGLPFGARYVALYLLFVAAFIGLFLVAPVLALGLALATAVLKGGYSDINQMDAYGNATHLQSKPQRHLAALVRGGTVMVVPFVFWTGTFVAFSTYMAAIFEPGIQLPAVAYLDQVTAVVGVLFGLGVVAHIGWGYLVDGASRSWALDVFETLLLVAYFAAVPVIVAVGLYFPLWYTLRQSGRSIVVTENRSEEPSGLPVGVAWAVLVVGALATALVAVVLWVVATNPLPGTLLTGVVAFYTVFVCIIALPHVVVGDWLDSERGIWYVP